MMPTEKQIKTAAKLYEFKDFVLKRKVISPQTFETVSELIKKVSKMSGEGILETAIELSKKSEGIETIWILGTAVILIED